MITAIILFSILFLVVLAGIASWRATDRYYVVLALVEREADNTITELAQAMANFTTAAFLAGDAFGSFAKALADAGLPTDELD